MALALIVSMVFRMAIQRDRSVNTSTTLPWSVKVASCTVEQSDLLSYRSFAKLNQPFQPVPPERSGTDILLFQKFFKKIKPTVFPVHLTLREIHSHAGRGRAMGG